MKQCILIVCLVGSIACHVLAQATAPATAIALPQGPLQVVITGVEGLVQVRAADDQPWQKAAIGMKLAEGCEFRTGPRSAVRFNISDDQTFTLDRLGTVKILRANFESGRIFTDLGMKYGRTRYDVESAEREHDTQVRSPSSVLAVRGTKVSITDQPPFAPSAVSLEGRAFFRDVKKQVSFGGKGKTRIDQNNDSPAEYAIVQTTTDPHGAFSGRTDSEQVLQQSLAVYGGSDFSILGVLAFLDQARAGNFAGSVIGALPVGRQLFFNMFWSDDPTSSTDVDLSVISPLGEIVSIGSPLVASGGKFLGSDGNGSNGISNQTGFGQESIGWDISFPPGTYQYRIDLKSGASADVSLAVTEIDPAQPDTGTQAIPVQGVTLNAKQPSISGSVNTPLPPTVVGARLQSLGKQSSGKGSPVPGPTLPQQKPRTQRARQ